MNKISVYYSQNDETGELFPDWLLLTGIQGADWSKTLFLQLDAPFERYLADELEEDAMTLAVPDSVYVRDRTGKTLLGLHLPSLKTYVERIASVSGTPFSYLELTRLLLRFSDIEDTLQAAVRHRYPWVREANESD
ncbi:hypothetical protein [Paenibacillus soyae]|uniref:Uncharacterized protein n=1 Tax=Paenibacillus soyae TaxID=2969249 RepID=A0A9X2MP15_9BACL|nr:hypothetical protein [Paenibacillus soyae]MCR2804206.1 hypothetical protein [Paenibacillus soyae]